ncbi:MAG: hypothetical protein SWX82_22960 [Cyanobacteriota bacterium]|nr:hypothetical protein [Cyanobacteriota bacterium]
MLNSTRIKFTRAKSAIILSNIGTLRIFRRIFFVVAIDDLLEMTNDYIKQLIINN